MYTKIFLPTFSKLNLIYIVDLAVGLGLRLR